MKADIVAWNFDKLDLTSGNAKVCSTSGGGSRFRDRGRSLDYFKRTGKWLRTFDDTRLKYAPGPSDTQVQGSNHHSASRSKVRVYSNSRLEPRSRSRPQTLWTSTGQSIYLNIPVQSTCLKVLPGFKIHSGKPWIFKGRRNSFSVKIRRQRSHFRPQPNIQNRGPVRQTRTTGWNFPKFQHRQKAGLILQTQFQQPEKAAIKYAWKAVVSHDFRLWISQTDTEVYTSSQNLRTSCKILMWTNLVALDLGLFSETETGNEWGCEVIHPRDFRHGRSRVEKKPDNIATTDNSLKIVIQRRVHSSLGSKPGKEFIAEVWIEPAV